MKFGTNAYMFTEYGAGKMPQMAKFFQTADELGFNHIRYLDHVIGINAEKHGGIAQTPYTSKSYIHEVFTLFAYMAALTKRVEFVTGVLVLTQRETCLVAKQAAEIDILSGSRLRLGMGVGYNPVEFEALNADFKTRGKRFEEQIAVLRAFWTQDEVTYKGQWHNITDASLSPSLGHNIPLWFGLGRRIAPYPPDAVLNRIGRLADGWLPLFKPGPEGEACKQKVHAAARAAGRDPAKIGMEMTLYVDPKNMAASLDEARRYRDFGATHAMVRWESSSPENDVDMLKRVADELIAKFK